MPGLTRLGQVVSEEFWILELNDDVAGALKQPRSGGAILDTTPQCLQVPPKLSRHTAVAIQAHDEVHLITWAMLWLRTSSLSTIIAAQPGMAPGVVTFSDLAMYRETPSHMCMHDTNMRGERRARVHNHEARMHDVAHHNWTKCLRRTRTANPGRSQKPPAEPERADATLLLPVYFGSAARQGRCTSAGHLP